MIDVNEQYETHIAARLLDFFGDTTPWHRGLWTLGLVLTLKELLEATKAVREAILHERSMQDLAKSAMSQAGRDPGVGGPQQLGALQAALRSDLRYLGMD
jgi:hypothetical protein